MNAALIIVSSLFGFLAFCSVPLLFTWSLNEEQRNKYRFLAKYHEKRLYLAFLTLIFLTFAGVTGGLSQTAFSPSRPVIVVVQGPGGEPIQKATSTGFKKELEDTAAELVKEAEDYFNAAERDFGAHRYQDAAANYRKSIDVVPTMSAYLNLGISLYYGSDFPGAEAAFIRGLQLARKKGARGFEGAFLGNIGNVYADQGEKDKALGLLVEARDIYLKMGARGAGLQIVEREIERLNATAGEPR